VDAGVHSSQGVFCWSVLPAQQLGVRAHSLDVQQVRASEPPDQGTIDASCPVHQSLAIKFALTNPTAQPLALRAVYSCPSLLGPASFVAGPGAEAVFECFYAPLLEGRESGVLRLISKDVSVGTSKGGGGDVHSWLGVVMAAHRQANRADIRLVPAAGLLTCQAGEFRFTLNLEATPALPEPTVHMTAPLGGCSTRALSVANPTPAEATFTCCSSCPQYFLLEPETFKVSGGVGQPDHALTRVSIQTTLNQPTDVCGGLCLQVAAHAVAEVALHYRPGSIGQQEHGTVTIASPSAGTYETQCTGQVGDLQPAAAKHPPGLGPLLTAARALTRDRVRCRPASQ
jgi:hypothetical protein